MSGQEHYEFVLKDLESRQGGISDELEQLEERRQSLKAQQGELSGLIEQLRGVAPVREPSGPFARMSILETAVQLLRERGKPMLTDDIVKQALAGGLESKAEDPKTTIYGVLHRDDRKGGEIAKVGKNLWALRAWKNEPDAEEDPAPEDQPAVSTNRFKHLVESAAAKLAEGR